MSDIEPDSGSLPWWLRYRPVVQLLSAILANSYVLRGLKGFCYPALNCWACPAANFGCPLGAMQRSVGGARYIIDGSAASIWAAIPIYVIGTLLLFSAFFGRMMCGWLCPFGWLQELVGKLSRRKLRIPRALGYLRYVVLVALVIIVPYYTHTEWFCQLCPMGALEGGLLQPALRPELRSLIGAWWWTKQAILAATVIAMVIWRRPFCGVICPLGAIFALFHRYSAWEIRWEEEKCVHCMWCVEHCPQGIDPRYEVNSHACIGCLECEKCPYGAIYSAPKWALKRDSNGREPAEGNSE